MVISELEKVLSELQPTLERWDQEMLDMFRFNHAYFSRMASRAVGRQSDTLAAELHSFQDGYTDRNFTDFLRQFLIAEMAEEELQMYQLATATYEKDPFAERRVNRFEHINRDAMFNLCLTYNGELLASIGFDVERGRFMIKQIQGVKGNYERLRSLRWQKALVNYVVRIAQKHDVPQVGILSVDNNRLATKTFATLKDAGIYPEGMTFEDAKLLDSEKEREYLRAASESKVSYVHLGPHQGMMLYDVTARKCGFIRWDDDNYYLTTGGGQIDGNIRKATISDRDKLVRFLERINHDFDPPIEKWDGGLDATVDMLFQKESRIMMHFDEGNTIDGVSIYYLIHGKYGAFVYMVGVSPDKRSSSTALALIREAFEEMLIDRVGCIEAGVFEEKRRIRMLLENVGFRNIGVEEKVYGSCKRMFNYRVSIDQIKLGQFEF